MSLALATARTRGPSAFARMAFLTFLTLAFLMVLPRCPYHQPLHASPMNIAMPDSITDLLRKPVVDMSPPVQSAFEQELTMSPRALLDRWAPFIEEASKRFGVPESWIRVVIRQESGGRTMSDETTPITSQAGAVGVMQVMPGTYDEMRAQYDLGNDATDPHDNILAGAAYLKWLQRKYGYPQMFAAYNDGPGNFDDYLQSGHALPAETVAYLANITAMLGEGVDRRGMRSRKRAA